MELSITATSSKALITFCLLAKEMRKVVCFYMLFAALEAIFLVSNKNNCQGGQIIRSSSCQSISKMIYLTENLHIEILMMIAYGDRRQKTKSG
jgi:hypothetical protein